MSKFSIIIPTLQKNIKVLNLLLKELFESDYIGEIILIDNTCQGFESQISKLKVINPNTNLYVNPAWNYGVKESKYEYIGILNDDILLPKNIFGQILDNLENNDTIGLIGLDSIRKTEENELVDYPKEQEIKICQTDVRENCWGSAIFGRKSQFYFIPEKMKIWCGDDYLFNMNLENGYINYKIYDIEVKHLHSNTSKLPIFDEIKQKDIQEYNKFNFNKTIVKKTKNKYDMYVSLGAGCSCTQTLRKSYLQYYSYPFDWLYGADFIDRIKIIANDFKDWINIEDLELIGTRENPLPCNIYKNKKTGIVFNHDFPLSKSLEDSYLEVKQKYERRIKRLVNQIEASERVLFVYLELPNERKEITNKDLIMGYEMLKNRFENVDINILYLYSSREVDYYCKKVIQVNEHVTRINFDYDAYNKEFPYCVKEYLLNNLFNNFIITNKHLSYNNVFMKNLFSIKKLIRKVFSIQKISEHRKLLYIFGIKIKFKRKKKKKRS